MSIVTSSQTALPEAPSAELLPREGGPDRDPETFMTRAIGTFLGLAVSAALIAGLIGLLHLAGRV